MKVIFLDFDGVLNSDEYFEKMKDEHVKGIENEIEINKVNLLSKAIEQTGANIVFCSSWRYNQNALILRQMLLNMGFLVDSTPYIENKREEEIKQWLLEHPETEDFIILDDETSYYTDEYIMQKLLKIGNSTETSFGKGLQLKDIDEIIFRLGIKKEKSNEDFER